MQLMNAPSPAPVVSPPVPVVASRRILYADDVRELRDVARISLAREGHRIECVEDGLAAFERVTADPAFDLVITDHHMPRMNGLKLVQQLRASAYRGRILVFSSELDPRVTAQYRAEAVDRILFKPVFPSELRRVLAEMFAPAAGAP